MTLSDHLGLSETQELLIEHGMQLALFGLFIFGIVTGQVGMAASGGLALVVTFLPAALRREYDYRMDAGLVLWITTAVFLHTVGSFGPYGWYSWYDEVTHIVSASLMAGVGYAVLRAFELHSAEIDIPSPYRPVFIIVFGLAVGVFWEVFEFGIARIARAVGFASPLTVYGVDDIVTDFIGNTVGAVIVAVWGADYFGDAVHFFRQRLF